MGQAKRDRPTTAEPPYPWKDYIVYLEGKVHRLEVDRDKLRAAQQQPSLFETVAPNEGPEPVSALTQGDGDAPDQNRLGGFTRDSETSRQAAIGNYPRSGNQRHKVLLCVFKQGQHGATFDEVRELTGIYSSDRRFSELVEGGWLERTERTRRTGRGEEAVVCITSQKAEEFIRHRDAQVFLEVTAR
jgi:hypothetical protein